MADAPRALGSVRRLCETGNRVVFDHTGSYIENVATGFRTPVKDTGNGYTVTVWVSCFHRQANP